MANADPDHTPTAPANPVAGQRLLTIRDLQALFRWGRTAAYARVHEDDFPAPLALSESAHRWWEHEVLDWVEQHRISQRDRARHRPRGLTSPGSLGPTSPQAPELGEGTRLETAAPRPVDIHRRERAS